MTTRDEQNLSVGDARAEFDYDAATGIFLWKRSRRGVQVGKRAGTVDPNGYRYIPIHGVFYLAQRLAWLYVYGKWPDKMLRFVNDDTDDCRIDNLRESEFDYTTKEGRNAADRDRRKRRPQVYRQQDLRKNFGIGLAVYQAMHDAQGGVCAICAQPETAMRNGTVKWLAVDHDHTGGKQIRSLLCQRCNVMIGHCADNPEVLRAAAAYLERHAREADEVAA